MTLKERKLRKLIRREILKLNEDYLNNDEYQKTHASKIPVKVVINVFRKSDNKKIMTIEKYHNHWEFWIHEKNEYVPEGHSTYDERHSGIVSIIDMLYKDNKYTIVSDRSGLKHTPLFIAKDF